MLVKIKTIALVGINTVGVDVEIDIAARGMPSIEIVGLANKAVSESKERVRSALLNCGVSFPNARVVVNLAPADLPKEGSIYDLPIAVGIICAKEGLSAPGDSLFFGELSLDGALRHSSGAFLLSLYAKENGFQNVYVPFDCAEEASAVSEVNVYSITDLTPLISHLKGESKLDRYIASGAAIDGGEAMNFDFSYVLGQKDAKRALEIVAAGGHNILMRGSPGGGKTVLARATQSILPPLSAEESLDVTKVYSAAGKIPPGQSVIIKRPFRSPHHTSSVVGLVGGGGTPRPGEISLAHRGVLFLDEFTEFPRFVVEALRQPLEDGFITISRGKLNATFPARFLLIAAVNPCACGYFDHPKVQCKCTPAEVRRYQKRLSGPILDRIDLHVNVESTDVESLKLIPNEDILQEQQKVMNRVKYVRNLQKEKYGRLGIFTNAELKTEHMNKFCTLSPDAETLLKKAAEKFNLSARTYFKLIKVARTIADLEVALDKTDEGVVNRGGGKDGSGDITLEHLAEALKYRVREYNEL